MIRKNIFISQAMHDWAKDMAQAHVTGKGYDAQMDKDSHNINTGYTGEAVFWKMHPKALHKNLSGYDFELDGRHFEVKTILSNVLPQPAHWAKIPSQDLHRLDDDAVLCFISVIIEGNIGWLCGFLSVRMFREMSVFRLKGELQAGSYNDFHYTVDCYELPLGELNESY